MNRRQIAAHCQTEDGTKVEFSYTDWSADDGEPDSYVAVRTTGGRQVNVSLKDGRELAGWLIEHCVEPGAEPTLISQAAWADALAESSKQRLTNATAGGAAPHPAQRAYRGGNGGGWVAECVQVGSHASHQLADGQWCAGK